MKQPETNFLKMRCKKSVIEYLMLCYLLVVSLGALSQTPNLSEYDPGDFFDDGILSNNYAMNGYHLKDSKSKIKADVYLFKKWVRKARLILKENKQVEIKNLEINYNILNDWFEIRIAKDSIFPINSNVLEKVIINEQLFNNFFLKDTVSGFFEILYDNKKGLVLLKKYNLRYREGTLDPLNGIKTEDEYHKYTDYFLMQSNGQLKEIKLNKKNGTLIFKEKQEEVRRYIKINKLSFKKEKDFIRLLNYFFE